MILIALGANLPSSYGSPEETLEAAKEALRRSGIKILTSSRTWLTAPVPLSNQPLYRNAVISIKTDLFPQALIGQLHGIEREFGRVRGERNAARLLDLDLLVYNKQVISEEGFYVPHPRMHERAFVLYPLQEIAPDWIHPVLNKTVSELVALLPEGQSAKPLGSEAA